MAEKNYYEILGVAKDADEAAIKKAYRKLVRKYHPDVSKEPDAVERTAEINRAYETLSDKEKRAEYDEMLANPYGRNAGAIRSDKAGTRSATVSTAEVSVMSTGKESRSARVTLISKTCFHRSATPAHVPSSRAVPSRERINTPN